MSAGACYAHTSIAMETLESINAIVAEKAKAASVIPGGGDATASLEMKAKPGDIDCGC
jgi:hypothetical protein